MRPGLLPACWILLLAACLAWAPSAWAQALAPIPALDGPVVDTTGTLDAATRQSLESRALALQASKGSQLQVLMVSTTSPEDIAQYAVRVFEQWKPGREGVNDGLLLVVAKDDRRVHIEVGYGLEGAIPDATAHRVIQEYLVPRFRAGDFAGGIDDATAALAGLVEGEPLPAPMVESRDAGDGGMGGNWLGALFAAFVVAQLARAIFGRVPAFPRGMVGGALSGGIAWLVSSAMLVGGLGAALGFFIGLASGGGRGGRFARDSGWGGFGGGGGWGGGSPGGSRGGGGWSGGGGMSGGGGASGSW